MSELVWYAAEVTASVETHEAIEYALLEAGALGTETIDDGANVMVRGYFDQRPASGAVRSELIDALRIYDLAPTSLADLRIVEVPDRDWLAEWKKNWRPVEVSRFIIAPPWIHVSEPRAVATGSQWPVEFSTSLDDPVATARGSDTILIRINPGMAFGTGTHETTRLCLKAIEKYFRGGSFLDVGTGAGILAIAAAKMFPDAHVEACDSDGEAIAIAKENADINGVADRIDFLVGTVDDRTPSADLVCANLTAPVIVELLPLLLGATCGRLVLSGILDSQVNLVESRLLELGANVLEIDQDGEWIALIV